MNIWKYKIIGDAGPIYTCNTFFAETKSKSGNTVFCKRENDFLKFK